ncbi:hypothetical protein [uncultured Flavobacterium sp.]|uniref:hypothetical protein n=1 Tax=uncultured Flavobacterium sp. TaxID=165435 RepID=UPI0030C8D33B
MDNIATNFEKLYEKAKEYTETSLELYRLNAIDKTADVVSSLFARLALLMVVAMFSLLINIALSLYIGKLLDEMYLGFLIVSGFYLIVAIILFLFSDKLLKIPLTNLVIAKLLHPKVKNTNPNISNDEIL